MTEHRGFKYGNYAKWDPRSDSLIVDTKLIDETAQKLQLPQFRNIVIHHEFTHRYFYKTNAIRDLVVASQVFNTQLLNSALITKLTSTQKFEFRNNIKHYFEFFEDVGAVLDAIHAYRLLTLYFDPEKKRLFKFDDLSDNMKFEELKKYMALILDDNSKNIFINLSWFRELKIPEISDLLSNLVIFSLDPGYRRYVNSGRDFNLLPSQILNNLLETLQTLYEKNSTEFKRITTEICNIPKSQLEWYRYFNKSIAELTKYNIALKSVLIRDFEKEVGYVKVQLKTKIFKIWGKKFWTMKYYELANQPPALIITRNSDNNYSYTRRKGLRIERYVDFTGVLGTSHFQECLAEEKSFECYLCAVGFCNVKEWKISKQLHETIPILNKNFYN